MTLEEKWTAEFEEWWHSETPTSIPQCKIRFCDIYSGRKSWLFEAYLQACRKRQEEVEELERLLCIAHDYLIQHWDMSAEPLRQIDEAVKRRLNRDAGL